MSKEDAPMLTVVSSSFPPRVSGSAILMANLLLNYSGKVSAIAGYSRYVRPDPEFSPPCETRYLALPRLVPRVYEALNWTVPSVVWRTLSSSIRKTFKELRTDIVLAAYPREDFLVAAFHAARKLRLPFYAHMHDLWIENLPRRSAAFRLAEKWEPIILKESTRVLCMTAAMQEYYNKKYGIQPDLLPHTIPEQQCLAAPTEIRPPRMSKPTVLFVGTISPSMNLDALKVLAAASELLPSEYELLFCTSFERALVNSLGICSSRLKVKYVTRAEVQRLQSEAHVLIAPLSHKSCSAGEVHTVFSTKLLEYLISGRPIVVFAPNGSYHAKSARENGWGYVVTEDSPSALAAAILKVATDDRLASKLVCGALKEARSRNAKLHAERLQEWVITDTRSSLDIERSKIYKNIEVVS
jgi:glycosyltransferase involved in cell wall biosynthesis